MTNKLKRRIESCFPLYLDGHVFTLDWGTSRTMDDRGSIDMTQQVIRVNSELSDDHVWEAFLHEILHGVWKSRFYGLESPESEEHCVSQIASGLQGLVSSNPNLRSVLAYDWLEGITNEGTIARPTSGES